MMVGCGWADTQVEGLGSGTDEDVLELPRLCGALHRRGNSTGASLPRLAIGSVSRTAQARPLPARWLPVGRYHRARHRHAGGCQFADRQGLRSCGRVRRTGASLAGLDKPVDDGTASPTALPTLSRLSLTGSTGHTTKILRIRTGQLTDYKTGQFYLLPTCPALDPSPDPRRQSTSTTGPSRTTSQSRANN